MQDEEAFRSGGARLGIKAHQVALSLADRGTRPPAPSPSSPAKGTKTAAMETFDKVIRGWCSWLWGWFVALGLVRGRAWPWRRPWVMWAAAERCKPKTLNPKP